MDAAGLTTREAAARLGVSEYLVRSFLRAGLVASQSGETGEPLLGFQDLVLLRTAKGLLNGHVTVARVRRALEKIRRELPPDRPLTGVALGAVGSQVVVREGDRQWNAESGQALLGFDHSATQVARPKSIPQPVFDVDRAFEAAAELEETNPAQAITAYQRLIEQAPDYADAHVNLGRLLQDRLRPAEAEVHYRRALELEPADSVAAYNLGTALEDQGRITDAIQAYAQSLQLDPACRDAHFNLARLYERTGNKAAAIRHLKSARQLR